MPTNDCFRCHDDEAPLPARQELASSYPKQSIDKAEFSPGMSALRTANCWRRARISSSILLRSQKSLLVTAKRDRIRAIMAFSYNRKEAYGCYHVDFKGGRSFGEGQGFLCVTEHHIGPYSGAFGPKLDPSFFRRLSATDFDPAMVWLSTLLRPFLMDNPRPSRYGKG